MSDSDLHGTDDTSEAAQPVIIDSPYSKPIASSGKPSVPQKPWHGLSFKPGKKVVLGIIVVIIIVAVVLGAFFIYPMIANSEGGHSDDGTALTTIPTITKNSGTTVVPTRTVKPTVTQRTALLLETAAQRLVYDIQETDKNLKSALSQVKKSE